MPSEEPHIFPVPFENYLHPQRAAHRKLQRFANPTNIIWNTSRINKQQHKKKKLQEIPIKSFENYCRISSIHGLFYIGQTRSWQRIFLCSIIALAVIITLYFFILNVIDMYSKYTQSFYDCLDQPIGTTAFPAVTICSLNRISEFKSTALAHKIYANDTSIGILELKELFKLALWYSVPIKHTKNIEYEKLQSILDANNMNLEDILVALQPSCSELFFNCFWRAKRIICDRAFVPISSIAGPCCQLKISEYLKEMNLDAIPEQATALADLGLQFMMHTNKSDYGALIFPSADFVISIHNLNDIYSTFESSHLLKANYYHNVKVDLSVKVPDENLLNYRISKRHCLTNEDPYTFTYYKNTSYTRRKCQIEAGISMWKNRCGCVQPFVPRPNNERLCSLSKEDRMCFVKPFVEVQSVASTMGDHCLPSCGFVAAKSQLQGVIMNPNQTFRGNIIYSAKDDLAVAVNFRKLTMISTYLSIYKTPTSLLASMGGLAGLQLGISIICIYEICFFAVLFPFIGFIIKQCQRTTKKVHIQKDTGKIQEGLEK